jgi:hypothetical protein
MRSSRAGCNRAFVRGAPRRLRVEAVGARAGRPCNMQRPAGVRAGNALQRRRSSKVRSVAVSTSCTAQPVSHAEREAPALRVPRPGRPPFRLRGALSYKPSQATTRRSRWCVCADHWRTGYRLERLRPCLHTRDDRGHRVGVVRCAAIVETGGVPGSVCGSAAQGTQHFARRVARVGLYWVGSDDRLLRENDPSVVRSRVRSIPRRSAYL